MDESESPAFRLARASGVRRDQYMASVAALCRLPPDHPLLFVLFMLADRYKLNPLLKEIGIMDTKQGPSVYVSVDGWMRVMTEHPDYLAHDVKEAYRDGEDPAVNLPASATAQLHSRQRRALNLGPFEWTERYVDCVQVREKAGPWQKSPTRMIKLRALSQAVRVLWNISVPTDDELREADEVAEAAASPEKTEVAPHVPAAAVPAVPIRTLSVSPVSVSVVPEHRREPVEASAPEVPHKAHPGHSARPPRPASIEDALQKTIPEGRATLPSHSHGVSTVLDSDAKSVEEFDLFS